MDRYDLGREVPAYFVPLDPDDQAAMCEHFGVPEGADLLPFVKEWTGEEGVRREGRVGTMSCANPEGIWDYWAVGGRWDGVLGGAKPPLWKRLLGARRKGPEAHHGRNSLPVSQLTPTQRALGVMLLTPDGALLEAPVHPEGEAQRRWEAERDEALARYPDHWVVAVDCHT
jgi:hypothetical protein